MGIIYKLKGRVTHADGESGVHGLLLMLFARDSRSEDPLDRVRTRRDGSFFLSFDHANLEENLDLSPEVLVRVFDRHGNLIHTVEKVSLDQEEARSIHIVLNDDQLADHISQPVSWEPIEGQLVPREKLDLIYQAISKVSQPSEPEEQTYVELIQDLLPTIDRFESLLVDAWETIAGDADATIRFKETLHLLENARSSVHDAPSSKPWQGYPSIFDREWLERLADRIAETEQAVPSVKSIISDEASLLLILATVIVGKGQSPLIHRYLRIVLDQLGAYETLNRVYSAACLATRDGTPGMDFLHGALKQIFQMHRDVDLLHEGDLRLRPTFSWPPDLDKQELVETAYQHTLYTNVVKVLYALWELRKDLKYVVMPKIEISHSSACAGTLIFISGKGFGNKPGKVRFRCLPGTGYGSELAMPAYSFVDVDPKAWTDTQIAVVVPQFASCGLFCLRIPSGTTQVGGKYIDLYDSIGPLKIGGTLPEILSFTADGSSGPGPLVVPIGHYVNLSWSVCPDDSNVQIAIKEDGKALSTKSNFPPVGSHKFPVYGTETKTYTCTLTAKTVCGNTKKDLDVIMHKPAKAYIMGLEITQATQFFGTAPSTAQPGAHAGWNKVPLIWKKPTLVRVYLASTQDFGFNKSEVKGVHVELRGYISGGGEFPGSPLSALNSGPYTARNLGLTDDCKDLNRTANFLIPTSWMIPGVAINLVAKISMAQGSLDSVDVNNQIAKLTGITFHAARPLDAVVVLVNYTKAGAKPKAYGLPKMADAINTLHGVRRAYPTDRLRIYLPEPSDRVLNYDGTGGGGNCGGFTALLDGLEDIAKGYDDDDDKVWWAAVKDGVPGVVSGCGSGSRSYALGYAASRVGDNTKNPAFIETALHEFGHAYDRDHTFDDKNYPNYGYSNSDSIGEFGVNVERLSPYNPITANNYLFSPYTASDYMSYDPAPIWTSPYTYTGLMSSFFAKKASAGSIVTSVPGPKPRRERIEQLVVCGTLWSETRQVKLQPLYHAPLYRKPPRGEFTRFELALVDDEGHTLVAEPIQSSQGRKWRIRISQAIPFHPEAAALEVRDGENVLARAERPKGRPFIEEVTLTKGEEKWRLHWQAHHTEGIPLLFGVAVTSDDGERWQRLVQAIRESEYELDPTDLAGGEVCRLRVFATDRFNTVYADSESFSLPLQPPIIFPLNFEEDAELLAGQPLLLEVEAISPRFGSLPGEQIHWTSDKQGELGEGREIWVTLEEGRHQLTISAKSTTTCVGFCKLNIWARAR